MPGAVSGGAVWSLILLESIRLVRQAFWDKAAPGLAEFGNICPVCEPQEYSCPPCDCQVPAELRGILDRCSDSLDAATVCPVAEGVTTLSRTTTALYWCTPYGCVEHYPTPLVAGGSASLGAFLYVFLGWLYQKFGSGCCRRGNPTDDNDGASTSISNRRSPTALPGTGDVHGFAGPRRRGGGVLL